MKATKTRLLVIVALLFVMLLLAACGQAKPQAPAASGETERATVRYRLDWLPRGNYAPLYVALEKGYFEAENLEVKIDYGDGSGNATRLVGSGEYQLGQSDSLTMLIGKSQGAAVKAVFMMNQQSPLGLVSLAETGIKEPKDLEGKVFGFKPGSSNMPFFMSLANLSGVDADKVEQVIIGVPHEPYLLNKVVDVVVGYVDAELPALIELVGGIENLNVMMGSEYGLDMYGTAVIANEEFLARQPDVARRFFRAYVRAWEDMINDPDEAVRILVKHNPELPEGIARAQLQADLDHTFASEVTAQYGWGYMTDAVWAATQDLGIAGEMLSQAIPVSSIYTNEFLPKK